MQDKYKDYTPEMRQALLGTLTYSKEKTEDLEVEMGYAFTNPDKHTWREGFVVKTFLALVSFFTII